VQGFPVTKDNRRALQLVGLARVAAWYGALVPATRVRALVEQTFGAPTSALWRELAAVAAREGCEAAVPVLAEAERVR
jgi:hypothetical protein